MRRLASGIVAAVALVATLLAPGAHASARHRTGTIPPGQVPCPSVNFANAGGSVLAVVAPDTAIPAGLLSAYGAVRYPGVPAIGLVPFAVAPGKVGPFMAALRALPGVRSVALDRIGHAAATRVRTPRDPLLAQQWGLAKIHASQAWGVEVGSAAAIPIAVLDTGVDATHPDLRGRVEPGIDLYDGDADASDAQFHGTAVASVIAADTDNKIGMAGVSWGAQILPVRVLGADGTGTECTIAAGIVYAADQSWVENLSLVVDGTCSFAMQQAVDFAVQQSNTIVVAAVGNDAKHHNPSMEPADCAGAVGVGATDQRDRVTSFSEHGQQVSVSAPGVHILAAYRTPQGAHAYAYYDGTSLAAPMVSGVAALLFARHTDWSAAMVAKWIMATSIDLGKKGRDDYYGAGRVDAGRALTSK